MTLEEFGHLLHYTQLFEWKQHEEIIEELLGITELSEKAELLKDLIKETRKLIEQEEVKIKIIKTQNDKVQQTIDDLKNIKKSFQSLIAGVKLPPKALSKMIRTVLSINSPVQFNAKIPILT
jgi:hypothetical protein